MFSIPVVSLVAPSLFRHIALPRGALKRGKHFSFGLGYTKSNLMIVLTSVCSRLNKKTKARVWCSKYIPLDLLRYVIRACSLYICF